MGKHKSKKLSSASTSTSTQHDDTGKGEGDAAAPKRRKHKHKQQHHDDAIATSINTSNADTSNDSDSDVSVNIRDYENADRVKSWIRDDMKKTKVLDLSSDDDTDTDTSTHHDDPSDKRSMDEFHINESYATKYMSDKSREEMSKKAQRQHRQQSLATQVQEALKNDIAYKHDTLIHKNSSNDSDSDNGNSDSDDESDSSDDLDESLLKDDSNDGTFDILTALQRKDYDEAHKIARTKHQAASSSSTSSSDIDCNDASDSQSRKRKRDDADGDDSSSSSRYTQKLKQKTALQQHLIDSLAHAASESDSENDESVPSRMTHAREIEAAKIAFRQAANDDDDNDDNNNGNDEDDDDISSLLTVKATTAEQARREKEEQDRFQKQVQDATEQLQAGTSTIKELSAGDKFLRDFILHRWYAKEDSGHNFDNDDMHMSDENKSSSDSPLLPPASEILGDNPSLEQPSLDDEIEYDDLNDAFESRYNFRFEEGQTKVQTYPRAITDSMRKSDTSRREKREAAKQRREEEKRRKKEEIKRLKAMKQKELHEQLSTIAKASGIDVNKLKLEDLLNEFNDDEYDQRMNDLYNQEFYSNNSADGKGAVDTEESIAAMLADEAKYDDSKYESSYKNSSSSKDETTQQLKRKAKELISQHEYDVSQYDYEDIIGGDLPVRFKYRDVEADSMGLDLIEIIEKPDNVLNSIVGMKKYAPYRDEYPRHSKYDDDDDNRAKQPKWKRQATLSKNYRPREGIKLYDSAKQQQQATIHSKKHSNDKKKQKQQYADGNLKSKNVSVNNNRSDANNMTSTSTATPHDQDGKLSASAKRRIRKQKLQQDK
jgi:protein KRI1